MIHWIIFIFIAGVFSVGAYLMMKHMKDPKFQIGEVVRFFSSEPWEYRYKIVDQSKHAYKLLLISEYSERHPKYHTVKKSDAYAWKRVE